MIISKTMKFFGGPFDGKIEKIIATDLPKIFTVIFMPNAKHPHPFLFHTYKIDVSDSSYIYTGIQNYR